MELRTSIWFISAILHETYIESISPPRGIQRDSYKTVILNQQQKIHGRDEIWIEKFNFPFKVKFARIRNSPVQIKFIQQANHMKSQGEGGGAQVPSHPPPLRFW